MQNQPVRNRVPKARRNRAPSTGKAVRSKKKNLATFLIKIGFAPLAMVGRCMQFFGVGVVAAFILGAAGLYVYSVFRVVPGSKAAEVRYIPMPASSPAPPRTVWLHGAVRSHNSLFEIGVLPTRYGPFEKRDGTYDILVPESDQYLVTAWNPDYKKFKMMQMRPDASGKLQELDLTTPDTARRKGPVNNQRNGAPDNYALAATRKSRARDGGSIIKNTFQGGSK